MKQILNLKFACKNFRGGVLSGTKALSKRIRIGAVRIRMQREKLHPDEVALKVSDRTMRSSAVEMGFQSCPPLREGG